VALRFLDLCKDSSETSGTGTLTLLNTGAAGWQTLKDAVDRGLAANGDTVRYYIRDTGDPVLFEEGVGAIGSGGLTLTRPAGSVRQSSSGTSLISWPSGGARDVILGISPGDHPLLSNNGSDYTAATFRTNLVVPGLATTNTFTLDQTVKRTDTTVARMVVGSKAVSGLSTRYDFIGDDSAGNETLYSVIRNRVASATDGAESATLEILTMVSGTLAMRAQILGGVFQSSGMTTIAGVPYENFPSGFVMLAESVPVGWVRLNETTERVPMIATAAMTGGATGGSWSLSGISFSGTSGSTVLTESQIPAHLHNIQRVSGSGGGFAGLLRVTDGFQTGNSSTDNTGGGTGHTHSISGSPAGDGNWRPLYRVMLRIQKN